MKFGIDSAGGRGYIIRTAAKYFNSAIFEPPRRNENMPEEAFPNDVAAQMLLERRYKIYDETVGVLADVEDAAVRGSQADVTADIEVLYNRMRLAMAFLSSEVRKRLDDLRVIPQSVAAMSPREFESVINAAAALHASLAKLLGNTKMEPLDEIIGTASVGDLESHLDNAVAGAILKPQTDEITLVGEAAMVDVAITASGGKMKPKMSVISAASSPAPAPIAPAPELHEERLAPPVLPKIGFDNDPRVRELEDDAKTAMSEKKYKKAIKAYGKILDLYPDRAGVNNDLGLAYRMNNSTLFAIEHYKRATELNEQKPSERSGEYYNVFYNLGMALKSRALDLFTEKRLADALAALHDAINAFKKYIEVSPSAERKKLVAEQIKILLKDRMSLEKMRKIVSGGDRRSNFDRVRDRLRDVRLKSAASAGGNMDAGSSEPALADQLKDIESAGEGEN
jgi:tetratricopeptide (TPR) repeat protein